MSDMGAILKVFMSLPDGPPDGQPERRKPSWKASDEYPPATESDMWRANLKAAMKEAVKEWLDDQFATFGKWSLGAIAALLLGAAMWLLLTAKGWKPPP